MSNRHVTVTCALATVLMWVTASAGAVEGPLHKPGLWAYQVSDGSTGSGGRKSFQQCIDSATDQFGFDFNQTNCSKRDLQPTTSGQLTIDSVCKVGLVTVASHTVITGEHDSSYRYTTYRMESKSSFDPPLMGHANGTALAEGKWLGACEADQTPGDTILPDGTKFNLLKIMGDHKGQESGNPQAVAKERRAPAESSDAQKSIGSTGSNVDPYGILDALEDVDSEVRNSCLSRQNPTRTDARIIDGGMMTRKLTQGVWCFLRNTGELYEIRLDLAKAGAIQGLRVGDGLDRVKSALGEPIRQFDFGGPTAYVYNHNELLFKRFDIQGGVVKTIFIGKKK